MNRSARVTFIVVAALLAAPAAARAATPIVYSSLPLSGADRASTRATVRGAQLALREAGNPFRFASLDDSSRVVGTWTPDKTSENARRAAHDAAAIGYIGEFNSGATAISLPVLNEAGIAMISPSNTALGLTVSGPGTEPGEPAKYYPTDLRTYFRLTPNDGVQGAALAEAMRQAGCTRIAPVDDRELYGRGVIAYARRGAAARGMRLLATRHIRHRGHYRALAASLARAHANCLVFGGVTFNGAVPLFRDVGRRLKHARLFGSDGVAESGFSRRLPRSVARRTLVTVGTLAPAAYPSDGRRVINRYHDPYAAYGYEAMRLFIDAYRAVGPDRAAIVGWLHGVQNRAGAIGTYGFDANGDTTDRTYGLYAIRGGYLTWSRAVTG